MKILIIDDNVATTNSLVTVFEEYKWLCDVVHMGEDGIEMHRMYDYDLVILDIGLPDISGMHVLQSLRAHKAALHRRAVPIIVLSAYKEVELKVKAFHIGADEYLGKPYHITELIARIRAVVRRSAGSESSVIRCGDLSLNMNTCTVTYKDQDIHLTNKEFALIEMLFLKQGTVMTKEAILSRLYHGLEEAEIKIIDVFICKIRKKIMEYDSDNIYIETKWGRGYQVPQHPISVSSLSEAEQKVHTK